MRRNGREAVAEKQRVVALYGSSLLMDTVEASLEEHGEMGVIRLHTTVEGAVEHLGSLCPDLVILELGESLGQLVLALVGLERAIPILCLDLSHSRVIVLECMRHQAATTDELIALIHDRVPCRSRTINGISDWGREPVASLALGLQASVSM